MAKSTTLAAGQVDGAIFAKSILVYYFVRLPPNATPRTIDTHTGGEPTRVVLQDWLDWRAGTPVPRPGLPVVPTGAIAMRDWLRAEADWIRRALLCEPRGCESMVGAYVGAASRSDCLASVVFFNNVGYLGMCGHGLIGVVRAMVHAGQLAAGEHRLETPVGTVDVQLDNDANVTFDNVPSFRHARDVRLRLSPPPGLSRFAADVLGQRKDGWISGQIAYGGNWFFILPVAWLAPEDIESLSQYCRAVLGGLRVAGIRGADDAVIDHIELSTDLPINNHGAALRRGAKNFVLCPGGHYDRSPCGTGTSAKVACLAADGDLEPGQVWEQESIIGSRFAAVYRVDDGLVRVTVTGRAHVCAETKCIFDPQDPYQFGIPGPNSSIKSPQHDAMASQT